MSRRSSPADIAVIVPTLGTDSLCRAVASLSAQTVLPSEVLIVLDAPDMLSEVEGKISRFRANFSAMHILCTSGFEGPSRARNLAANKATATFLAFLDDDDEFYSTKIAVIERHAQEADLITHAIRWSVNEGTFEFVQEPGPPTVPEILIANTIGPPSSVIVRRSAFLDLGGFRSDLPALEDYELWLRFIAKGYKATSLDVELSKYTVTLRNGSRSSKNIKNDAAAWRILHLSYEDLYKTLNLAQRARHLQYIFKGRMHRNRSAGNRLKAAAWAAVAFAAYPSLFAFPLLINAMLLPFFSFGFREFATRVSGASSLPAKRPEKSTKAG